MLLHHIGHINKFVLDISVVRSERHCDVDICLSFLSTRGVKVLELDNSTSNPYTIPSCVFSNSDLTSLSISNCILKTKMSFTSLNKLEILILKRMTLSSWTLVTSLLSTLKLSFCCGIHGFIISAPRLVSLGLYRNDDLSLFPYLECSNITGAYICVTKNTEHQRFGENINLMKLLICWPKISEFFINGISLERLTKGIDLKEFELELCLRHFVPFSISLSLDQIAWVLCILQNSPHLRSLEIRFSGDAINDLEVVNYLEEPNIMNQSMEQLRIVKMEYFSASRAEFQFMKILLHSAPSLERMLVEEDENLDLSERLRILKELMRLQREFPNAEIIFWTKAVCSSLS